MDMPMPSAAAKDEVSALARGLALLKAVADAGESLSNKDLATITAIPKATVSRLTATLLASGLLRQVEGERFSLGAATLHLSTAYLRTYDFRQQARLHLAELAEATGANVHLGVRDGLDIVLIDTLRPESALILSRMDVGSRLAIATSAAGRAYLASLPSPQQSALLDEIRRASGTSWPTVETRLNAAIKEHARLGFCSSFGEWHPDIHALGFTLRGPRGEHFAVSVGGPAYKLPKSMLLEKVAPRIVAVRETIEREAGHG